MRTNPALTLGQPRKEQRAHGRHAFTLHVTHLAITFAVLRPGLTREELMADLVALWGRDNLEQIVVAFENFVYRPGEQHAHVYVRFTRRRYISSGQIYAATRMHPYISSCDDGWLDYILKWDVNAITLQGNILALRAERDMRIARRAAAQKPKISDVISTALLTDTVANVAQRFPAYALHHLGKMKAYKEVVDQRLKREADALRPAWKPINLMPLDGINLVLAKYINFVMDGPVSKEFNLLIWGPTNCGKSRLLDALEAAHVTLYKYNANTANFQTLYEGGQNLNIWDEFIDDLARCGMSLPEINKMLDGRSAINTKYAQPVKQTRHIPWIFITNKDPALLFVEEDMEVRKAFIKRFQVLTIKEGQEITLLKEHWDPSRRKLLNLFNNKEKTLKVAGGWEGTREEPLVVSPLREELARDMEMDFLSADGSFEFEDFPSFDFSFDLGQSQ